MSRVSVDAQMAIFASEQKSKTSKFLGRDVSRPICFLFRL